MIVALLIVFRLMSGMGSLFLFNTQTYVEHILQRILSHDLFDSKRIVAGFQALVRAQLNSMFINIIHSGSQPPFVISSQHKVLLDLLCGILPGSLYIHIDEDIVEIILLRMP